MSLRALRLSSCVAVCAFAFAQTGHREDIPVKKPFDAHASASGATKTTSTQILYHGGPVMNISNSVYVIYYGNTFASTTEPIINDFLHGLSGSAAYGVNGTYNEGPNTLAVPPTYSFSVPGSVYIDKSYSQGTQVGNSTVPKIVANAINNGLASDPNGVYLVVTSPDVKVSGFCNSFCAYHTKSNITLTNGTTLHVRYALVPDPTQKCSGCNGSIAVYGDTVTPNGDTGADTMTDDIMHELSETVTDPDISAWYTQSGEEDADLCNYVYGDAQTGMTSTGSTYHYNVSLPGIAPNSSRNYLVQQIWKNSGAGSCASN